MTMHQVRQEHADSSQRLPRRFVCPAGSTQSGYSRKVLCNFYSEQTAPAAMSIHIAADSLKKPHYIATI